jgi:hypothetical protein
MSSRFRFKNSKLKKINKQQENNSEEINISEDLSSDSKNTITRNQTGGKKRRSLIRLSRKHSRKNGKINFLLSFFFLISFCNIPYIKNKLRINIWVENVCQTQRKKKLKFAFFFYTCVVRDDIQVSNIFKT